MANLPETDSFDAGVYQLETTDAVVGGVAGKSNAAAINLANRTNYLKKGLDGMLSKSVAGSADVTLTASEANNAILKLTGVLTGNINVIFPNSQKPIVVNNATTGNFTLTCKTAAGTGKVVTSGLSRTIWGDGTNIVGANSETDTATQFDNSTKPASTAFVKLAGTTLSNFFAYNASATLPNSEAGGIVEFYGSTPAQTLTLPLSGNARAADVLTILNYSSVPVTISRQGAEMINWGGGTTGTSIVMQPGDSLVLVAGSNWFVAGGTAQTQFSGLFGSSLASNGYQKLPSGIIIQWGNVTSVTANTNITWTYPIAFPNACLKVFCTPLSGVSNGYGSVTGTEGTTSCPVQSSIGSSSTLQCFAIGY